MSIKKIINQIRKTIKSRNKIKKIKCLKEIGAGFNGTCYKIDDYVVIDSAAYRNVRLERLVELSQKCEENGTNIVPILSYFRGKGVRCFILQKFCKGEHLYTLLYGKNQEIEYNASSPSEKAKMFKLLFLKHLKESKKVSSLSEDTLTKFIKDYFQISSSGIEIDPYNTENFLVNENGICFIDLGLREGPYNKIDPVKLSTEIIEILLGVPYKGVFKGKLSKQNISQINDCKKIILNKTFHVLDKLNIPHLPKNNFIDSAFITHRQTNENE